MSWVAVEAFGLAKHDWLATFLQLPYGIPSHDTFGRVFGVLDSKQFERCFFNWIAAVSELTQGEIIPIDGKQLRRSHDREDGKAAIHLVSAWSSVNGLALGQVEVTDKSNEITAFPKLLEVLDISGCIVTIDAMGCQTEIAEKIVEAGGDYVLALKKNQGHLYGDLTYHLGKSEIIDRNGLPIQNPLYVPSSEDPVYASKYQLMSEWHGLKRCNKSGTCAITVV